MKTAQQNKTIAQQARAQREPSLTQLEVVLDLIDSEAENGGMEITTALTVDVKTELNTLGYQTSEISDGSGIFIVNWNI